MIPNKTEVDAMFTRIEATHGVTMRANFLCCQSCGHAKLADDHMEYGFYHVQDMEAAARDGKLYIAFSTEEDDDVQTAETIVNALRSEGCTVEWDGTARKRIILNVEGQSFDRFDESNIPREAEYVEGAHNTTIRVWENRDATERGQRWEYRIIGNDGFVWHADTDDTKDLAISRAHATIPSLDIDNEDEITEEQE
jgi:hypothetical protein